VVNCEDDLEDGELRDEFKSKKQEEGSKLSEPRVEEKLNYEVGISCIFQGQNSYA
jgi:hypothetical protein